MGNHDHAVRAAAPSDAVMLHLVAAATFPLAAPGTPQADIQLFIDQNLGVERFHAFPADPERRVFIAEVDGTPAGYAMLNLHAETDPTVLPMLARTPSVELNKFYLLAGRQGTGLADELMEAVLAEARKTDARSIWLGVHDANDRPNAFYDRHRFVRRGKKLFQVGTSIEVDLIRERLL